MWKENTHKSQIVLRAFYRWFNQKLIYNPTWQLVNSDDLSLVLFFLKFSIVDCVPANIQYLLVCQAIENSITPQDNKVVRFWLDLELRNLWLGDYNSLFASKFG